MSGILPGTTSFADPNAPGVAGSTGQAFGTGTGQQGIQPVATATGGVGNAINAVWQWINMPFTTPLDPVDIGLIVGIVMAAIVFWSLVLYHVRIAAEAI